MSSYAVLRIGGVTVGYIRNVVDSRVLAAFTDDMLVRAHPAVRDTTSDDEGNDDSTEVHEDEETVRFVGPAAVVSERLDLLGITAQSVADQLQLSIDAYADRQREYYGEDGSLLEYLDSADKLEAARIRTEAASALTVAAWLEVVATFDSEDFLAISRQQLDDRTWVLELIEEWQWHDVLRLMLLLWPTEQVVLDMTDLIESWLDPSLVPTLYGPGTYTDNGMPSIALTSLQEAAGDHSPIVVLTEGRTDAEFLEASLRVLHPHLQDLVRFLDYSDRPEGGAGALARLIKSFAAAGIANRTVALFDNDAAARDAMRGLDPNALPANIAVRRYPEIELARAYPTLGPPSSSAPHGQNELADVNGLAASIEMYLGADVLAGEDGQLTPVQWRAFMPGVRAYQGEILNKPAVHERFRQKLRRALESGTRQTDRDGESGDLPEPPPGDWSGLDAILNEVISAFRSPM